MESEKKNLIEKNGVQDQPKMPYTTPQMTVHGTVEEITKGLGTKAADAPLGSMIA